MMHHHIACLGIFGTVLGIFGIAFVRALIERYARKIQTHFTFLLPLFRRPFLEKPKTARQCFLLQGYGRHLVRFTGSWTRQRQANFDIDTAGYKDRVAFIPFVFHHAGSRKTCFSAFFSLSVIQALLQNCISCFLNHAVPTAYFAL